MKKYRVAGYGFKFGVLLFLLSGSLLISVAAFADSTVAGGGYTFVSDKDEPGRAAEYQYNESSPTFDLQTQVGSDEKHLGVEVDYNNENDYRAESHFDWMSVLRVNVRLEKLFHNLDHIPYDSSLVDARNSAVTYNSPSVNNPYSISELRADYADQNIGDDYSIDAETFQMDVRYKIPNIPAHINLGYWRFKKEGSKQLRFVDEDCATACHLQSRTRKLDRVTNEFTASADAHLGFFDLIVKYLYRDFRDQVDTPVDTFSATTGRRLAGSAEHSEDPDSKMQEATLATHTSLAGGVVANLAYTLGTRENQSSLTSVSPVKAEVNYRKFAGDLVFTPADTLTMVLRVRQLRMDFDNNRTISSSLIPAIKPVRESLDLKEKIVEVISNWRLNRNLKLKVSIQRSETGRDNVGSTLGSSWQLPEKEVTSTFRLGGYYKSLCDRCVVINTIYTFKNNTDPAYTLSSTDSHELLVSTSLKPDKNWGITASARAGMDFTSSQESYLISSGIYSFERSREKQEQNINVGIWTIPAQRVNLSFNYGFFRTEITQDLLFGNDAEPPGATWSGLISPLSIESGHTFLDQDVEFLQQVHMLTVNLGLQLSESVNLRLSGRYTRAKAEYSPHFAYQEADIGLGNEGMDYLATSEGLSDIGRVDLEQTGAEVGVDWRALEHLSCRAEVSLMNYNDKNMSTYDGSVTRSMLTAAYYW